MAKHHQFSEPHDPSEITLIWWFALYYIYWKHLRC